MTSTRCDKCNSENIESVAQINLLQYEFYCKSCHENFILTETDELKICKRCLGSGYSGGVARCGVCKSFGYLDWASAVLKGQIL